MSQNGHNGQQPKNVENVIIIGSGPSGLTAGLYTARANLNPLLITGNEIGGQVAITNDVENYPGFPESVTGPELVEKMQQQAEKFGCRIEIDTVEEIDLENHPFSVRTAGGETYQAKAIVVSTGASARRLGVPGELELTGRGVSYCATCDGFFFRGKDIIVVGGGDSALEEGLFLTRFANKVTIIHRRSELRASQILQRRAQQNEKIEFVWDTVVTSINHDGTGGVTSVTLENLKTAETRVMPTGGIFIYVGHYPNSGIFKDKLQMDEEGYVITDKLMATSVPGVYAAGEIQDKRFKQVATSVGQGCAAAMEVEKFLAELEDRAYAGREISRVPAEFKARVAA